ncbi:MAG: aa3-type cytochrome c oxidase subunit IV [Pseudomonadota bacterium]
MAARTAIDGVSDLHITHSKGLPIMANSQDIKPNEKTYDSFIGMLKWTLPLLAVITLFVVLIIQ